MLKACILFLFVTIHTFAFSPPSEHIRKSRWDVSPIQIKFLATFFAIELVTYSIISPEFVKQEIDSSDYDFDEDDIEVPVWAYQLGNHGPEVLTAGMYGYYLFGNDEYAFEKAFVFTESMFISQGITFGTKYAVNKQRPDESNYLSFPSGHTTHAFTVGMWMSMDIYRSEKFHENIYIASLPLIYASYIGWTRIDANKHSFKDVATGALIGSLTSYFMYEFHFDENGKYRFNNKSGAILTPTVDPIRNRYGLSIGVSL
ncbi:phosphatase PAP2 family protein [Halobacteriovorax sp.]|uniref:phosphatase PAP2 family protein n=1 Tax=Halobacteriovorax sp. TaxID=2020862 RepID=UPI003AF285F8